MKDAGLKEILFKHFWAQRIIAQPEVDVCFGSGASGEKKLITDIDILALRPHPGLRYERVLGDCKTLRGQSPVNRAIWVRGLMDLLGAEAGWVLLDDRREPIEPDHKLAAIKLRVQLMNQADFAIHDRCIVYPRGSSAVAVSCADVQSLRAVGARFPKLTPFLAYLYGEAWQKPSPGELIRQFLGRIREVRTEFDPRHPEHIAVVLDAAAIFSIGLAEVSGEIFHQYLHPSRKEALEDALRILLWGGVEQYRFYQKVRQALVERKTVASVSPPEADEQTLVLPEWPRFVQLVRAGLEAPEYIMSVPWMLRQFSIDVMRGRALSTDFSRLDLLSLKHAMLVSDYVCRAAGLPGEFATRISSLLVGVQSAVLQPSQNTQASSAGEQPLFVRDSGGEPEQVYLPLDERDGKDS